MTQKRLALLAFIIALTGCSIDTGVPKRGGNSNGNKTKSYNSSLDGDGTSSTPPSSASFVMHSHMINGASQQPNSVSNGFRMTGKKGANQL